MSRKTDELESRCRDIEQKLGWIDNKLDALSHTVERLFRDMCEIDDRIDHHIAGKTNVMLIENLEAYRKGKDIKDQIDYISEVLGDKDGQ